MVSEDHIGIIEPCCSAPVASLTRFDEGDCVGVIDAKLSPLVQVGQRRSVYDVTQQVGDRARRGLGIVAHERSTWCAVDHMKAYSAQRCFRSGRRAVAEELSFNVTLAACAQKCVDRGSGLVGIFGHFVARGGIADRARS